MKESLFSQDKVPLELLRKRAYNFRWAEVDRDVIPLTAADPDFPVAEEIRDAICEYASQGVFSYGPHQGLPEFKQTLSDSLQLRKRIDVSADRILPIDSAASGMYAVTRAIMKPGDEAIIFDPIDFLFEQSVRAAGGSVVRCPYDASSGGFRLERLELLVTPKTRMIGVCNPHNPLGRLMRPEELNFIAEFAEAHDMWILNDEIWSDIVFYPSKFFSLLHLPEHLRQRVITVYGFSKAFGLAGLRVGAILAPDEIVYRKLVEASYVMTTAGGVSTLSQIAATRAMEQCWYWVDGFVEHLTFIRNEAVERLNAMPGIECISPEATYLLFPEISATGLSADDLVDYLQREARVALVPGNERFFGPGARGHIRLCFATSKALLTEALDRMENALNRLNRG